MSHERISLARLQVFQRRCLEHRGDKFEVIHMTAAELDELVHEIFVLRRALGDVREVVSNVAAVGWHMRSKP